MISVFIGERITWIYRVLLITEAVRPLPNKLDSRSERVKPWQTYDLLFLNAKGGNLRGNACRVYPMEISCGIFRDHLASARSNYPDELLKRIDVSSTT